MHLNILDTYNKELPPDDNSENTRRQVFEAGYSYVRPLIPSNPVLIHLSKQLAKDIGLEVKDLTSKEFLEIFSGTTVYPNTKPYAMAYAGHQFGNWAGQLGDGRAINLFEANHNNNQWYQ